MQLFHSDQSVNAISCQFVYIRLFPLVFSPNILTSNISHKILPWLNTWPNLGHVCQGSMLCPISSYLLEPYVNISALFFVSIDPTFSVPLQIRTSKASSLFLSAFTYLHTIIVSHVQMERKHAVESIDVINKHWHESKKTLKNVKNVEKIKKNVCKRWIKKRRRHLPWIQLLSLHTESYVGCQIPKFVWLQCSSAST